MPTFDVAEYRLRLDRVKARMDDQGIEVLLCTGPANIAYLSGYDGWSFYVPQLVAVALDHPTPIWIGRGMDANAARLTSWLPDADILPYPDDCVQNPARHAMDFVAEELIRRGWGTAAIGLEMDSDYLSPRGYETLKAALPNARFRNGQALVNWVRSVKSPAEIAVMEQAARILEKTMAVAREAVAPGVRQCDAAARILAAQVSGTAEFGGDYTAIVPMLPSGKGTNTPHLTWSDAPFCAGELTILELAGCRQRYHCPQARTLFLGTPSPKIADTAKVVVEGLNAALDAARPGALAQDVEAAWRAVIARHGLIKDSRIGYSIGLAYPPDWGEHTISLRPGDRTVLQPNMTLHVIPGLWLEDWGIEISESIHITETGARPLANVERALFVTG